MMKILKIGNKKVCQWCNVTGCKCCRCPGYDGCSASIGFLHRKGEKCVNQKYGRRLVCNACERHKLRYHKANKGNDLSRTNVIGSHSKISVTKKKRKKHPASLNQKKLSVPFLFNDYFITTSISSGRSSRSSSSGSSTSNTITPPATTMMALAGTPIRKRYSSVHSNDSAFDFMTAAAVIHMRSTTSNDTTTAAALPSSSCTRKISLRKSSLPELGPTPMGIDYHNIMNLFEDSIESLENINFDNATTEVDPYQNNLLLLESILPSPKDGVLSSTITPEVDDTSDSAASLDTLSPSPVLFPTRVMSEPLSLQPQLHDHHHHRHRNYYSSGLQSDEPVSSSFARTILVSDGGITATATTTSTVRRDGFDIDDSNSVASSIREQGGDIDHVDSMLPASSSSTDSAVLVTTTEDTTGEISIVKKKKKKIMLANKSNLHMFSSSNKSLNSCSRDSILAKVRRRSVELRADYSRTEIIFLKWQNSGEIFGSIQYNIAEDTLIYIRNYITNRWAYVLSGNDFQFNFGVELVDPGLESVSLIKYIMDSDVEGKHVISVTLMDKNTEKYNPYEKIFSANNLRTHKKIRSILNYD